MTKVYPAFEIHSVRLEQCLVWLTTPNEVTPSPADALDLRMRSARKLLALAYLRCFRSPQGQFLHKGNFCMEESDPLLSRSARILSLSLPLLLSQTFEGDRRLRQLVAKPYVKMGHIEGRQAPTIPIDDSTIGQ